MRRQRLAYVKIELQPQHAEMPAEELHLLLTGLAPSIETVMGLKLTPNSCEHHRGAIVVAVSPKHIDWLRRDTDLVADVIYYGGDWRTGIKEGIKEFVREPPTPVLIGLGIVFFFLPARWNVRAEELDPRTFNQDR